MLTSRYFMLLDFGHHVHNEDTLKL